MNTNLQNAPKPASPPPLPQVRAFEAHLNRFLKTRRKGTFLTGILKIAATFILAVIVYAVIDYFLALGSTSRILLSSILIFAVAGFVIREIVAAGKCSNNDIARLTDDLSESRRRPVLTALELLRESETTSREGMGNLLVSRSVSEANAVLEATGSKSILPRAELNRNAIRATAAFLLILILGGTFGAVTSVVIPRLTTPWRDIPPYSPLTFEITPTSPEIFYGDDTTIEATITGGDISGPVRFLTRNATAEDSEIFETICFQDGPNRFAQKLERVTQPTEFAFAHGKARSHWYSVDLLMEPKIALGSVTVSPPEYTGLPQRTFLVGEQPLAVLRGSHIKLSVTSNRPLTDGSLNLTPLRNSTDSGSGVKGVKTGTQSVSFEWIAKDEASAKVEVRDIRGTPNRTPYTISQRIIPDKAPEISLEKPAIHLMATPSIEVPIKARAEDDLGLARVEMVRTVVGFRDRSERIGPAASSGTGERRFDFDTKLNLSALGVQPGETLEVYFQAVDRNPSFLGIAASEVSRIQIISDEEYANMIRTRTTIEEFAARYRIVNEALDELAEKLEALKSASEGADAEAIEEAQKKAALAAARAEDLFEMLSQDFKAFDLEGAAISQSAETLDQIRKMQEQLSEASENLTGAQIDKMLETLKRSQDEYGKQEKEAQEVAAVSELMRKSIEFSHLVRDQDTLTRRLKKFETETRSENLPFLKKLGEDQEQMQKRLNSFSRELKESIKNLPPGYDDLRASAEQFSKAIDQSGASREMGISGTAASNEDGAKSFQYSSLALEKLNAILSGENSEAGEFGELASGNLFFSAPGRLEKTLSQMLSALCLGMGQGNQPGPPGSGSGGSGGGDAGLGGNSDDGYSMAGYTALDIPVLGPPRMKLESTKPSRTGSDESDGTGGDGTAGNATEQEQHDSGKSEVPESSRIDLERHGAGECGSVAGSELDREIGDHQGGRHVVPRRSTRSWTQSPRMLTAAALTMMAIVGASDAHGFANS